MNAKQRAIEIYTQHIQLASTNGKLFRKTVMDQLQAETGCSLAAAATHYNNAKKQATPVEGLGRAPVPKGIRKPGSKAKSAQELQDDNECFTVIELLLQDNSSTVGRCTSHLMQGDASEDFDDRVEAWPNSTWIMVQGLGPNHGDTFKLASGEKIIKRHDKPGVDPVVVEMQPEAPLEEIEEEEEITA